MAERVVRLSEISIRDLKNVKHGSLDFHNPRKRYQTSVLGLYGQNGSGKTALIDALQILKYILCGKPIPVRMADYINVDSGKAELSYTFDVSAPNGRYKAYYECSLKRTERTEEQNFDPAEEQEKTYKIVVSDEVLSYSFEGDGGQVRKETCVNTRTEKVFIPVSKYECLVGKDKELYTKLLVTKQIAAKESRSFLFSRELLEAIREVHNDQDEAYIRHRILLESLVTYGNFELFIINTSNTGMISMNALPLAVKYVKQDKGAVGKVMLPLEKPTVIPEASVEIVEEILRDMNIVLEQIVPGLTISLKKLGTQVLNNGKTGTRIQLMSRKSGKEIPLKNESEGIKKIISILQLLIVFYNQSSITVAIDELDSGIFEYLLGEILRIISEKGKGQLIFTSHNLRPLETLDRGFIAFTTTNPDNRYIRMSHVKDNNNLRDFYFRDIVLGEQSEEVYEAANNAEIALAFRDRRNNQPDTDRMPETRQDLDARSKILKGAEP